MSWHRLFLLFVLFVPLGTVAQTQSTDATLTGTLTDPSGAAIPEAQITISPVGPHASNAASLRILHLVSDRNGHFAVTLRDALDWVVRVTHPSFMAWEEVIHLTPGESRVLDLSLQIERLAATVVVTAEAQPLTLDSTPAPVTLITRQDLENRQAVSLPDLLATQPGVALARTGPEGGLATIFIDGGNSNFTKLLVDGAPVTEGGRQINFSSFTLDNVEKIEIVHGAESALYGSDAASGVVQLFTRRGTTRIPELTLLAEGGSFSTARGSALLSGVLGPFDYSAAAAYFETDGQGPNDGFLNRTLSGNFGWRFSPTNQIRLALRNNASDAGIPGPTLFLPPSLSQFDNLKTFSGNLTWEFRTGAHWQHRFSGSESRIVDLNANPPFFAAMDQFNRAGLEAQTSYLFRQGSFTAGYEYEVENAYPSLLGGQHARRNNQAGYLDGRFQPFSRLTLTAGARAEANTSFGTRVVPRAGVAYLLRTGRAFWGATRLRFFYGQGIKEPELEQSFGSDPCFPGNPSLRAERSRTFHAGIEQLLGSDRLHLSAHYFENRFYDIISFAFNPVITPRCPFGQGTYFNTDLARARGVNLAGQARPLRWLMINANYSYDDSRVLKAPNAFDPSEGPGNHLLRRPLHSGNIVLNGRIRRMNWNLAAYFTGRRTDSDFLGLGLTRNPGYARFDLAASYALSRGFSVFARASNLFDKQYQDALGFPALGRDVRAGMKYTFHRE